MLIEKGARLDWKPAEPSRRSACHIAASLGLQDTMLLLLGAPGHDAKLSLNFKDGDGNTPLALAAQEGHRNIVLALLTAGSQVDATNTHGEAPLLLAARGRHAACVRLLLESGAFPAIPDSSGTTATDIALASFNSTRSAIQRVDAEDETLFAGSIIQRALHLQENVGEWRWLARRGGTEYERLGHVEEREYERAWLRERLSQETNPGLMRVLFHAALSWSVELCDDSLIRVDAAKTTASMWTTAPASQFRAAMTSEVLAPTLSRHHKFEVVVKLENGSQVGVGVCTDAFARDRSAHCLPHHDWKGACMLSMGVRAPASNRNHGLTLVASITGAAPAPVNTAAYGLSFPGKAVVGVLCDYAGGSIHFFINRTFFATAFTSGEAAGTNASAALVQATPALRAVVQLSDCEAGSGSSVQLVSLGASLGHLSLHKKRSAEGADVGTGPAASGGGGSEDDEGSFSPFYAETRKSESRVFTNSCGGVLHTDFGVQLFVPPGAILPEIQQGVTLDRRPRSGLRSEVALRQVSRRDYYELPRVERGQQYAGPIVKFDAPGHTFESGVIVRLPHNSTASNHVRVVQTHADGSDEEMAWEAVDPRRCRIMQRYADVQLSSLPKHLATTLETGYHNHAAVDVCLVVFAPKMVTPMDVKAQVAVWIIPDRQDCRQNAITRMQARSPRPLYLVCDSIEGMSVSSGDLLSITVGSISKKKKWEAHKSAMLHQFVLSVGQAASSFVEEVTVESESAGTDLSVIMEVPVLKVPRAPRVPAVHSRQAQRLTIVIPEPQVSDLDPIYFQIELAPFAQRDLNNSEGLPDVSEVNETQFTQHFDGKESTFTFHFPVFAGYV